MECLSTRQQIHTGTRLTLCEPAAAPSRHMTSQHVVSKSRTFVTSQFKWVCMSLYSRNIHIVWKNKLLWEAEAYPSYYELWTGYSLDNTLRHITIHSPIHSPAGNFEPTGRTWRVQVVVIKPTVLLLTEFYHFNLITNYLQQFDPSSPDRGLRCKKLVSCIFVHFLGMLQTPFRW